MMTTRRTATSIKPLLLASLFVISGCAVVDKPHLQIGPDGHQEQDVTYVYTYNQSGKPISSGKVAKNQKLLIESTDPETKRKFRTEIDAGGWILVRPDSNVAEDKPVEWVSPPKK